jgi:hypothetical protein
MRRDTGRLSQTPVEELPIAAKTPSPSFVISSRELLALALGRMSLEERHIAEQRLKNVEWSQIAKQLGKQEDAVRMKFYRAVARIAQEFHP